MVASYPNFLYVLPPFHLRNPTHLYPSSFPSFASLLMGPNSVTGHSSVLFNTECTVLLLLELLKPFAATLRSPAEAARVPAPTVEVTEEAEGTWYEGMRREMETRVWEKAGDIVRFLSLFSLSSPFLLLAIPRLTSPFSSLGTPTPQPAESARSSCPSPLLLFPPSVPLPSLTLDRLEPLQPLEPMGVHAPNPRYQEGSLPLDFARERGEEGAVGRRGWKGSVLSFAVDTGWKVVTIESQRVKRGMQRCRFLSSSFLPLSSLSL